MVDSTQNQESVQTKICDVCQKDIETSKFRLHEVACARNNFKCEKCGEVVPKCDKEQHEEDVHTEKPDIVCPQCQEFKAKTKEEIAKHSTDQCINRQVKCEYCPRTVEMSKMEEHAQYCGSKTQLCNECGTSIQTWMMEAHKQTGECANKVLDKQQQDQERELAQVIARSSFEDQPSQQESKPFPNSQISHNTNMEEEQKDEVQPSVGNQPSSQMPNQSQNADMDENEREIARIMAEEANAIDAQNIQQNMDQPGSSQASMNDAGLSGGNYAGDGVRPADESRYQVLAGGPSNDFNEFEEMHNQPSQSIQRQPGGIASSFMGAAQSVAYGLGNMFAGPMQPNQPQPMNAGFPSAQPGGDNMGINQNFGDEDPELQAAMAASLAGQQNPDQVAVNIEQTESCVRVNQNPVDHNVQHAEDEALARALAESMAVEGQGIQPQPVIGAEQNMPSAVQMPPQAEAWDIPVNPQPGNDLAETEEEMINRAIEESKNAQ